MWTVVGEFPPPLLPFPNTISLGPSPEEWSVLPYDGAEVMHVLHVDDTGATPFHSAVAVDSNNNLPLSSWSQDEHRVQIVLYVRSTADASLRWDDPYKHIPEVRKNRKDARGKYDMI